MRRNVLRRMAAVAGSAALVAGVVMSSASAADAGTCGTPNCGGVVQNATSNRTITVANNWCWSLPTTTWDANSNMPCASGSGQKANAVMGLEAGKKTSSYYYYYDTDAFFLPKGCQMNWYAGPSDSDPFFQYSRKGLSTGRWYKIFSNEYRRVTYFSCA